MPPKMNLIPQRQKMAFLENLRDKMFERRQINRWFNSLSQEDKEKFSGMGIEQPSPTPDPRFNPADPNIAWRGTILPVGRTSTGERSWAAPQIALDMLGSVQLPKAVAGGYIPSSKEITQMAMDTMGGGLLFGRAPVGSFGANVWHGSPHRWASEPDFPQGRPRLDKIGTGEGVQAYGRGFYSADSPGVAKEYKRNLGSDASVSLGGAPIGKSFAKDRSPQAIFASAVAADGSVEAALSTLKKNIKEMEAGVSSYNDFVKVGAITQDRFNDMLNESKSALKWYDDNVKSITFVPPGGSLYKLDLPDEDIAKMLDWDAPVSENVLAALDGVPGKTRPMGRERYESLGRVLRDKIKKYEADVADVGGKGYPGSEEVTGEVVYKFLQKELGSQRAASEALRKAGIPGVKYYDQMSRSPVDTQLKINTTESQIADFKRMLVDDNSGLVTSENKVVVREALKQAEAELNKLKNELDNPKKRTRNYVTWDQDVLDRTKILEGGGMGLLK